jgi:hypothetical protein
MAITNHHKHTSQEMDNSSFDETLGVNMVEIIGADGELQNLAGMNIPVYDYVSRGWTAGTFTEVWTFKTGGSGGTTVATVTIVYDDVDMTNIISVTKT